MSRLNYPEKEHKKRVAESNEKILKDLYMILDKLCLVNKEAKRGRFGKELDKNVRKIKKFNIVIMKKFIYYGSVWF